MQARAELSRTRTEPECTFKPEIHTKKSAQAVREGNVFDTLYKKVCALCACVLAVCARVCRVCPRAPLVFPCLFYS